jgi:DNA-binding CsgD family transcriptional regulator
MTKKRELPAPRGLVAYTFELAEQEYVVFEFRLPQPLFPAGVTAAERAVVRAILDGASNKRIAALRGTSPRTVANQLAGIYRKLKIANRAELVALCAGIEPHPDEAEP